MNLLFGFPSRLTSTRLSPLRPDMQTLQPTEIVAGGSVTSTFRRHMDRAPPSNAPGLDIDTNIQFTESPPYLEKLSVRSPVSGKVTFVGGNYGTVRIIDSAGYEHNFLHMHLDPSKVKSPSDFMPVSVGEYVERGQIIGLLGNVHVPTKRDHVHYHLRDQNGKFIDPDNIWRDDAGAVRGIRNQDRHFEDLMRQERRYNYDNINANRFDNVA